MFDALLTTVDAECGRAWLAASFPQEEKAWSRPQKVRLEADGVEEAPPPVPELQEVVVAHTGRVVKPTEAAREWDAMTQAPTRTMIQLSPD